VSIDRAGGACSHSRAPSVHHGKLGTNERSNDKRDCWLRDPYALAGPGTRCASAPLNLSETEINATINHRQSTSEPLVARRRQPNCFGGEFLGAELCGVTRISEAGTQGGGKLRRSQRLAKSPCSPQSANIYAVYLPYDPRRGRVL
jgi:hypothetical protein